MPASTVYYMHSCLHRQTYRKTDSLGETQQPSIEAEGVDGVTQELKKHGNKRHPWGHNKQATPLPFLPGEKAENNIKNDPSALTLPQQNMNK